MQKRIACLDLDAFFVEAALLQHPDLREFLLRSAEAAIVRSFVRLHMKRENMEFARRCRFGWQRIVARN